MKTTRRLCMAAAGPLLVALLLGVGAWLYVDVFGMEVSERQAVLLGYLFAWPLLILKPFIPASDSQYPNAGLIRVGIYLLAALCVWLIYSVLFYLILSWRERRNSKIR